MKNSGDEIKKMKRSRTECKICGVVTELLSDHMKRSHLNRRDFKCSYCSMTFVYSFERKLHMYLHTGEKPYACRICNERFSTPKAKTIHEDSHEIIEHKCRVCKKIFYYRTERSVHEKKVHTSDIIEKYQCVECRKRFSNEVNLERHMRVHNINLKCRYCPILFSKYIELNMHEREHIRDLAVMKSLPVPPRKRKKRGMYIKHIAYKPKPKTCLNVLYPFKCCLCSESFMIKSELKKHYDLNHPDIKNSLFRFVCAVCGKRFLTNQALYQHRVCHSTEKHYKCTKCSYRTARQGDLRLHNKNHHLEASFKCQICKKMFKLKHLYLEHLNIHENKSFQCKLCNKSYPILKHLRVHLFKHVAHYICSICGLPCPKSAISNHLSVHRKDLTNSIHKKEDEKRTQDYFQESSETLPYEYYDSSNCKICAKKLGNRNAFLKHIKTHGDDELTYLSASSSFECFICGLVFPTFQNLESHKIEHVHLFTDMLTESEL